MTDRAILIVFFSMCLGSTLGTLIREVYFPFEDVHVEIQLERPAPEQGIDMYSEVKNLRCI